MKRLTVIILLALLLAGCASNQGSSRGNGGNSGASWECRKVQTGGYGTGMPCN